MDNSLNDIASQIINDVYAGIKQPHNISLSRRQLKDEITQSRNRELQEMIASGSDVNLEPFMQTIFKIPVTKKDFSGVAGYESGRKEFYASIPELFYASGIRPIAWVTTMNMSFPFKVIYGNEIFTTRYDKYSSKAPTIWVSDKNLWLLNPPIANIQNISFRGILENPRSINGMYGMKFIDDDPYPAPGYVIDRIKNKMINDYIRRYRMGSLQPTLMAGDINVNSDGGNK